MKIKKKKKEKKEKKESVNEVLLSTKLGFTNMNVRLNVDYNISDGYYL